MTRIRSASSAFICGEFSYCPSCLAFSTHSSQQTVISFPATVTLMPPSLIAQSHTGHLLVFIDLISLRSEFERQQNIRIHKIRTSRILLICEPQKVVDQTRAGTRR